MSKYRLIVIVSMILIISIVVFCLWFFNTEVIFHRRLNFKLPKTVDIVKKSYSLYEGVFRAKISFEESDYQVIVEGVENYALDKDLYKVEIDEDERALSFEALTWWNPEEENAILAYHTVKRGSWITRRTSVHILITQNNNGLYFLHVRLM